MQTQTKYRTSVYDEGTFNEKTITINVLSNEKTPNDILLIRQKYDNFFVSKVGQNGQMLESLGEQKIVQGKVFEALPYLYESILTNDARIIEARHNKEMENFYMPRLDKLLRLLAENEDIPAISLISQVIYFYPEFSASYRMVEKAFTDADYIASLSEILEQKGSITNQEAKELLNIDGRSLNSLCTRLHKCGKIKLEREGKNTRISLLKRNLFNSFIPHITKEICFSEETTKKPPVNTQGITSTFHIPNITVVEEKKPQKRGCVVSFFIALGILLAILVIIPLIFVVIGVLFA